MGREMRRCLVQLLGFAFVLELILVPALNEDSAWVDAVVALVRGADSSAAAVPAQQSARTS